MEEKDRNKICAFTGHRDIFFNTQGDPAVISAALSRKIGSLIGEGYNYFISGMAVGSDMLFARLVLLYKRTNPGIFLECALPNRMQDSRWNAAQKKEYAEILASADLVTCVNENGFDKGDYFARNRYMADKADILLAVYNGKKSGGTAYTVEYARSIGLKVVLL